MYCIVTMYGVRATLKVEERIECVVSKKVRYSKRDDTILTLPVPLEAATNKGKPLFIYKHQTCSCYNFFAAEVQVWEAKKKELEANKQRM